MVIRALILSMGMALPMLAFSNELGIQRFDIKAVDPSILEQAQSLIQDARSTSSTLNSADRQWLEELSAKTPELAQALPEKPASPKQEKVHPLGDTSRTLIFVSWSLGATAIKDIMVTYDGRPATGVVFRGIPEGMSMGDAVSKMHMLTQETQSQVSVLLDPLVFSRHQIDVVPAIVIEEADNSLQVKATGTTSTRLLESAMEADTWQAGADLGIHGPTSEIIEPDLMEVAKARIDQLDTEAMKKRAIERFWHVHTGTPLPPVLEPAVRQVDPSVIIENDILDHHGNVVQKAGRINPLEMMPFNQKLVVIDPSEQWQVELATREYADHGVGMTVTVMATQIPPTSGWGLFQATEEAIDAPLYLLPADMAERFQILRAPSVVTAEGLEFVVREYTKAEIEGDADVAF